MFALRCEETYNDLVKYVCSLENGDFVIHHYHPCAAFNCEACKLNSRSKWIYNVKRLENVFLSYFMTKIGFLLRLSDAGMLYKQIIKILNDEHSHIIWSRVQNQRILMDTSIK